jgi:hypothetical protein
LPARLINGSAIVLSSASGLDENTLTEPTKISPVTTTIDSVGSSFKYTFKANSVTILKLNTANPTAIPTLKKKGEDLTFYPNPAKNSIQIKGAESGMISVELKTLIGKSLLKKQITTGNTIDISTLTPGVYLLVAQQGKNKFSGKVIKY